VRRLLLFLVFVFVLVPASGASAEAWQRPVGGVVIRRFDNPTRYGPGHRGVDFVAPPGTQVRAAGPGEVVFAGTVGYSRHVVILHAGGLRTSYSFLATIGVRQGERVAGGAIVGTAGGRDPGHDGTVLHFGLRRGDAYLDPLTLFATSADPPRVHLAPAGGPVPAADEAASLAADLPPPPDYPVLCVAQWCRTAPSFDDRSR
jgi:murein DD-endopeptidase MepM/ murein hydrolase activator NlpD